MKLTCPSCGAAFSIDAALNDKAARQAMAQMGRLPETLTTPVFEYLAYFRPQQQGLRWSRVAKLLEEIVELVREGFVEQGRRIRPSPTVWAAAIAQLGQRQVRRPLNGHGYLKSIVADQYARAEGRWETERDEEQRKGQRPPPKPEAAKRTRLEDAIDAVNYRFEAGFIDAAERDRQVEEIRNAEDAR